LLAAYDTPAQGGNGDGTISAADAVFSRLRLWIDANHDGVSQPGELVTLAAAGVVSIDLTYRTTGRRDGHGNYYRYRGLVHLASGRTVPMWDVFLAVGSGTGSSQEGAEGAESLDDDEAAGASNLEGVGFGAGEDGAAAGPLGAAGQDPPPTPLQVVEYYHLDVLALRHGAGRCARRRLRATLSERVRHASRMGRIGSRRHRRAGPDYRAA
jgi:hypothetical protein